MSLSNTEKMSRIRRGEPITLHDLTFYPIRMSDYEQFLECKDALILRMGTLPVKYQSKDYLAALYAMELDTIKEHGMKTGLFERVIRLFFLSLRIGLETMRDNVKIAEKTVNGETVLDSILVSQDGQEILISTKTFSKSIRPLLAEINGLELPDESENVDLVRGIEELNAQKTGKKLNQNVNDLIASVAYLSHKSEREIDGWTVREFEARRRAIERDKRYTLYGQAEMSGMVTFKDGNPAPSWCFDAIVDDMENDGLQKLGQAFGQQNQNKGE